MMPLPTPSAGVAYERERALRLQDPRCRANYELYLQAPRASSPQYRPIKLDIENVSRCNLRCTMCQVSDWPKSKRADDMTLAQFKDLLDAEYGLLEVKLQGVGEPLLGKDFFKMIRYARARHIWVRTTTNATLLHLHNNYQQLVDSGVNEIQVSIDGADAVTFESVRRGARFDHVVHNCCLLNAYAAKQGVRVTKMWTVVQRVNRHQLSDLVFFGAHMGFRDLVFSLDLVDWSLPAWTSAIDALRAPALNDDEMQALVAEGGRWGVCVAFWQALGKYTRAQPCAWPFERSFVGSDSRVSPCCMIGNPDVVELGPWGGPAYRAFRQAHLDGVVPGACKGCYREEAHG
jgi:sulfatase maturation enzyme AslB (radical SAM superfamily)